MLAIFRPLSRAKLAPTEAAQSVHKRLMQVLARACGHTHLNQFNIDDLTTWEREIAYLTGGQYAGVVPLCLELQTYKPI